MPFLSGSVKHNVLLFDPSEGRLDEELLRSSEVRKYAKLFKSYPCSRSVSPEKRQRSSQPWEQTESEAFESESSGMSPFDLDVLDSSEDWEPGDTDEGDTDEGSEDECCRGRRSKRSFEALASHDCDPPSLGASPVSTSDASIATEPNELSARETPPKGSIEPFEPRSKRARISISTVR